VTVNRIRNFESLGSAAQNGTEILSFDEFN
jgi:hypothetical protein